VQELSKEATGAQLNGCVDLRVCTSWVLRLTGVHLLGVHPGLERVPLCLMDGNCNPPCVGLHKR